MTLGPKVVLALRLDAHGQGFLLVEGHQLIQLLELVALSVQPEDFLLGEELHGKVDGGGVENRVGSHGR